MIVRRRSESIHRYVGCVLYLTLLACLFAGSTKRPLPRSVSFVEGLALRHNDACTRTRRDALRTVFSSGITGGLVATSSGDSAFAAGGIYSGVGTSGGLAAKLAKGDPAALRNSVFNIPPIPQVYPPFMRGVWNVKSTFRGYIFPSKISKAKVTADIQIPGFQKCSIAQICDVGKDASYKMKIDSEGLQDRPYNFEQVMNAYLGYQAIQDVLYDEKNNPNRISIDFVKYQTRNAERIELFCNARESELVSSGARSDGSGDLSTFVCSEFFRQVTFSYSQEFGVARQVNGNYGHFWTWRELEGGMTMTGNLLTAAYLDPQDPLFFDEPSKPVAVYSHDLLATKQI